jgi:hypothetical protein
VFTDDLANGQSWSTLEIVRYLVEYFQPLDWLGANDLPCSLTVHALATLPDWDEPLVQCEKRTLRDLLNQLCDRRRNMAWRILIDEDEDPAELKVDVFSFLPEAITLPSGAQVVENFDLYELRPDKAIDVRAVLTNSNYHKVDQVVVRGSRKRSCFSLSWDDQTLTKDWTAADETSYKDGPSPLPSGMTEKQRAVIEYRREDDLRQVYAYFKVPDDWDFEVGNGEGGAASAGATGDIGSSSGPAGFVLIDPDMHDVLQWGYLPELRFSRELFEELSSTAPATSAQDRPLPFAVIETETGDFRLIDQLVETAGVLDRGPGKGRTWAASLTIRNDCPGIIVRVSGAQQLVLAATDFPVSSATAYELAPQLDYQEMIVTVAAETFGHVTSVWPASDQVDDLSVDQATKVYVDIGDAGHLDYVVPNTIVGLDDGELVRHSGGYVRDDRTWMEDLARYAYEWYSATRQAFEFSMEQVLDLLSVGQLITKVGTGDLEEEVNSVVVGVTFDFSQNQTTVDTAFSNLDTQSLLNWFAHDERTIARARRQA